MQRVLQIAVNVEPQPWSGVDSERDLIERAQRDREAFALLYRRHYAAIARYLYRRTGNQHATEDLVADVFLALLRTLPRFRYGGVPLRSWLYRVATNAANQWTKRRRSRAPEALNNEPQAPPDADPDPELEHVQNALLSLSTDHQAVLALHYFEQLGVEQIAEILDCRTGTVKSRLARARDTLREALQTGRGSDAE